MLIAICRMVTGKMITINFILRYIMLLPIKRDILYKNHTIAIQILSQTLAETTDQKEPYFVISIVPWNCDEAKIKESENLKDILRLSFDDTETGKNAISSEQAEKIKDFVLFNLQKGVNSCIIHCLMGVSRSAGVGAAISKAINGEDDLFFKYYTPNMTCYRKVLNAFLEN